MAAPFAGSPRELDHVPTKAEVLRRVDVLVARGELRIVRRSDWWLTRLFDNWLTADRYKTTYTTCVRLPWQQHVTIAIPDWADVRMIWKVMAHELVHFEQWTQEQWLRMALFYASDHGRLQVEAPAFAVSLMVGHDNLRDIVDTLYDAYFIDYITKAEIATRIVDHLPEWYLADYT